MILAEIKHRKKSLVVPVIFISIGMALVLIINTLITGFTELSGKPLKMINTDITVQRSGNVPENMQGALFPCSAVTIKKFEIDKIRDIPEIINLQKAILLWVFDDNNFKNVIGIELKGNISADIQKLISEGRIFTKQYEAVADKTYALNNNLVIGSKIKIADKTFNITGFVNTEKSGNLIAANFYIPYADAAEISEKSKEIQKLFPFSMGDATILFINTRQSELLTVERHLKEILGENISIASEAVFLSKLKGILKFFIDFSGLFTFFIIIIALSLTLLSILHNLNNRKQEIGVLKAVGWTPSEITGMIVKETAFISLIGSFAGILISLITNLFLKYISVDMIIPWEMGSSVPHFLMETPDAKNILTLKLPISLNWHIALSGVVISVISGMLFGYFTGLKGNKIKPVEALKYE